MSAFKAEDIYNLDGVAALVTGGVGTGIGLMAAKALAANGVKVYITGRREQVLQQAIQVHGPELRGSLSAIQADVTSKEHLKSAASKISEGYLHILINNAGIEGPVTKLGEKKESMTAKEISQAHLDNEDFKTWDDLYKVNSASIFFSTMTFLPLLEAGNSHPPTHRKNNWSSSVTNITSISGIVKIAQNHYAYNSSKAAANSLTLMLANELNFSSKVNIRVNALAPGLFASEMTSGGAPSKDGVTDASQMADHANPAGRTGDAEEMASGILFLATNGFVNGQVLAIDGGFITAVPSTR
ncbi:hypothetical protein CBS101457_000833 [Exobasidium rhododendri]|nr:hypothetical protein CBS101457_000833 [Exobasidium rhododendri]